MTAKRKTPPRASKHPAPAPTPARRCPFCGETRHIERPFPEDREALVCRACGNGFVLEADGRKAK